MYGIEEQSFKSPASKALTGCIAIFTFFVWLMVFSPDHGGLINKNVNENLRFTVLNVGQGDSILMRTPMGKNYLIDGGPGKKKTEQNNSKIDINQYLTEHGIRRLDGIIITHWHADHIIGLINVLKRIPVDCVYEPPFSGKGPVYQDYKKLCEIQRIGSKTIHSEQIFNFGEELYIQILNPVLDAENTTHNDQNNCSVVLLIRYGRVQTLLTGDIEKETMRELMKYGDGIKSQIIKIPNHGSESSYYLPFIKQVAANSAIICVGENNPFGHPSDNIIKTYEKFGAKIYRTDTNGTININIGGKEETDYNITCEK